MPLYGLGGIAKAGVEGWAQGEEDQHQAERRPQELLQADLENEDKVLRNENTRRIGQEFESQLDKRDRFRSAYEKRMGDVLPDFSPESNHAWREYNAAVATGSPQMIEHHMKKFTDATNQDLLGETGRLVNQAINSQGAESDFNRINSMFQTRKMQLKVVSSDANGFVVEGPNGLKNYTHQGFLNEMNRALNPNAVYGQVQTEIRNKEIQSDNEKAALAAQAKKVEADSEKIAEDERIYRRKMAEEEILYGRKKSEAEALAKQKHKDELEMQRERNKGAEAAAKIRAVPRATAGPKAPAPGSPEAQANKLAEQMAATKIYERMRRAGKPLRDTILEMRNMGYTAGQIEIATKSGK